MTNVHQLGMDLTDYIDELTRPHTHREHYTAEHGRTKFGLDHVTDVPPLLHQLQFAVPAGAGEESSGGGYESRPAASIHSIDTLTHIDLEAARWVRELGEDDPTSTIACVRMLAGLAAGLERCKKPGGRCCTYHQLDRDVRRWWAQARIVTGWDSPAWKPDSTCPMCGERGSLRVKLVEQIGLCSECRETWDDSNIGLLAEHIREESAGERPTRVPAVCWCPWPRPAVDSWPSLCSSCGSPWCHRGGWAKTLGGPTAGAVHGFVPDLDDRMGA